MSFLSESETSMPNTTSKYHTLNDIWSLWAHMPHDTDWGIKSYKKIIDIDSIEVAEEINKKIPDTMIKNCMVFCMRQNIHPTWEDENNRNGGSFSFKISNTDIYKVWNELILTVISEILIKDELLNKSVNGITVSPKKNFCILKIWMKSTDIQNLKVFNLPSTIDTKSTIFKKHIPEN